MNPIIMANWFDRYSRRDFHDWTIRQLNLQPYQHVLEVGYGSGRLLSAVAEKLRIGFLAGIESSISLYQRALRRNKAFIRRELMQLHIGELYELSYPAHYFHTIYLSGTHSRKNPAAECLRLVSLLRSGGRLVWASQAGHYSKEEDLRTEAARLQAACLTAGLTAIHTEYHDFPSGTGMAITGIKPDLLIDPQAYRTINNRLLNSKPHFISNIARMQM
jgi:protein-L-isoaspartate O-methyltransferase